MSTHEMFGDLDRHAPVERKIECFRSLFRGRVEVYARRFESAKSGKTGYQPACAHEWMKGICGKPKQRCGDCQMQKWLPVTDQVVFEHLSGVDQSGRPFVMGVYPMLLDEHCWFLAVDFDGDGWVDDSLAYLATCRKLELPAALERSRSGDGGHVWMFFSEALPASLARKLGAHLLTETMEFRPELGLRSYDRLFPNQDTLPRGGFGNLIALPLQKRAREQGNSVFLNESLLPYEDQWAFLSGLERCTKEHVESLVIRAEHRGRTIGVRVVSMDEPTPDTPWDEASVARRARKISADQVPVTVEIVFADQIYVPKAGFGPAARNALLRMAAFQNPEFYRAQAMRMSTHDKPRVIQCAEDHPEHLGLPRGCMEELLAWLAEQKVGTSIRDLRCLGNSLDLDFSGILHENQATAGAAMLEHEVGVLAAGTAFGKTVLAAWLIAQRGVNTLILVHRQQLLEQWIARLAQFLKVEPTSIGRWGGGKRKLTGRLDVALIQSLCRKGVVDEVVGNYGHLVVDECHHIPAVGFELVLRRAKARFVVGLSATITRKDGHHPVVFMQCGPVRYRVDARKQAKERPFEHEVWVRPTGFLAPGVSEEDRRMEFQRLCGLLATNAARDERICEDVVQAVGEGRFPIVLTERSAHLERMVERLSRMVSHVIVLQGGMGRKSLLRALDKLKQVPVGEGRVLVATGRFVGEGFDDARLDSLFLAMPISWRGTIAQYVGRLHRLHEGKSSVRVYDYVDLDVPMLAKMFEKRCSGYEAQGYRILLPASALPGWPVEVPLPIDPAWKQSYSESIHQLIHDGVDISLAQSFLLATTTEGIVENLGNPARSASEAFFFRRLESLPNLAGKFTMNTLLPIPFDDHGRMEVDFLCKKARVVVEIDGGQHLGSPEAWRRDRRKDLALQQHGYLVLRFLAEDLGKRIGFVLETLDRVLKDRL